MTNLSIEQTNDDLCPSYLAVVGPVYRQDAINAVFELNQLSAGLHNMLMADPFNAVATASLGNAVSEAHARALAAMAGLGAAISCVGAA